MINFVRELWNNRSFLFFIIYLIIINLVFYSAINIITLHSRYIICIIYSTVVHSVKHTLFTFSAKNSTKHFKSLSTDHWVHYLTVLKIASLYFLFEIFLPWRQFFFSVCYWVSDVIFEIRKLLITPHLLTCTTFFLHNKFWHLFIYFFNFCVNLSRNLIIFSLNSIFLSVLLIL